MNNINEIKQKIYQIIAKHAAAEAEEIKPEAHFGADLNVGDLELAEIAAAVEKEFNVTINKEALLKIDAVKDLVSLVFDQLDGILDEEEI
jgi:acyl carrier protein